MSQGLATAEPQPTGERAALARLVRAELRWIFHRPRTLVVLGLLACVPIVLGVALTLVDAPTPSSTDGAGGPSGPGRSLLAVAGGNAFVLPIAALAVTLTILLPLATAMASADALAGETAHGTLRGWLLAPVGRGRLLGVKACGVATVALTAVLLMAVTGLLTGLLINGPGALFTISGTTLSLPAALGKIAVAAGWVTVQLWAVGAVALAISACTEHPMLVVASILAGSIVFSILLALPALDWLHPFLLNDSWSALADILRDPIPGGGLVEGLLRALCYVVIGLSLAYGRITTRDG